ncbi:MAG TPA: histidine kinase, partial [Chitinophagaceae bacterium]|nr:histidine kinase [Chitinophagaceae bacterium]
QRQRHWYIVMLSLVISGLCIAASRVILASTIDTLPEYLIFLNRSLPMRFGIAFLLTAFMAMISVMWYTFEDQKETEKLKNETEKLSREAELYKLRQQLQPHFLFNSLNSISALTITNPGQARAMIQQLSDFLRSTLKKEEQQWIKLSEEIQHLELYLAIEKIRFGDRLATVIQAETSAGQMKLPTMLLQPVVENAIKFGLYDTTGDILISINAKAMERELIISVQNPFDPQTSGRVAGTGFGLNSVQRRLQLIFARNDLLATTIENDRFTTIVKIPQRDDQGYTD